MTRESCGVRAQGETGALAKVRGRPTPGEVGCGTPPLLSGRSLSGRSALFLALSQDLSEGSRRGGNRVRSGRGGGGVGRAKRQRRRPGAGAVCLRFLRGGSPGTGGSASAAPRSPPGSYSRKAFYAAPDAPTCPALWLFLEVLVLRGFGALWISSGVPLLPIPYK